MFNSIKKSPRRHVAELQGGFSSLAESSAGSQQKTDEGINQQIFSQSEEAMVTPTVRQSSSSTSTSITAKSGNSLGAWPCMDELDKSLIKISLPVIANFAIAPLVGTIDLFFINQMGNALAVAGQAAANQVFGSVFWLTSFLPSRKSAYPHYNCIGVSCTRFSNSTTNWLFLFFSHGNSSCKRERSRKPRRGTRICLQSPFCWCSICCYRKYWVVWFSR